MGQILHGSARTTEAVRRAIQHSQESLRVLAKRYGINPKTVAKWKARPTVTDKKIGPKAPRSTVLSVEEEAVIVAFWRYALQPTIPHLTRDALVSVQVFGKDGDDHTLHRSAIDPPLHDQLSVVAGAWRCPGNDPFLA
jgi:hypothetical protein